MAAIGALVGAFLGQALLYEILRWGGGTNRSHPYRQIIVFNLFIVLAAIALEQNAGRST